MENHGSPSDFQTTCWTQVNLAARRGADEDTAVRESLGALCQRYWYPLYAYLRRTGHDAVAAEDYVQAFFADVLARNSLTAADPDRGRFRSFLLAACKNFVANQLRHQRTLRRGGGQTIVSLDTMNGEQRYVAEPVDDRSPEKLFDRRWALETIDAALQHLQQRYRDAGKEDRFLALRSLIAPAGTPPSHAEIADQLRINEGAVKVAAHRLRQQFAAALRDQVSATVDLHDPASDSRQSVDAELAELLAALGD